MTDAGIIQFGIEQKAIDHVLSNLLYLSVTGKDHIYEWLRYSSIDTLDQLYQHYEVREGNLPTAYYYTKEHVKVEMPSFIGSCILQICRYSDHWIDLNNMIMTAHDWLNTPGMSTMII